MDAPKRPRLFTFLGIVGLLLGGFGSMYSLSTASQLLDTREHFVSACKEGAERQSVSPELRDELVKLAEREGEAIYARRGLLLPLCGMDAILSFLLFFGCLRALRGNAWGLSAWNMAALASIPYHLLDAVSSFVQARELTHVVAGETGPLRDLMVSLLPYRSLVIVAGTGTEVAYFGLCLIYLRRPIVRALFTEAKIIDRG